MEVNDGLGHTNDLEIRLPISKLLLVDTDTQSTVGIVPTLPLSRLEFLDYFLDMYASLVHTLLYSLLTTSRAIVLDAPAESTSKRCEMRNVYFHYNDSTLGSMPSCSWDVMSLAAKHLSGSLSLARSRGDGGGSSGSGSNNGGALSPRQSCPPGSCTDGPATNYTVQPGDTLEMLAAMFNSGVCNIAKASGLARPEFLEVGQQLTVPTEVCDPDNDSCRTPPGMRPCVPRREGVGRQVRVQAGDTLFLIGTRLNLTADALVAANLCVNASELRVGQVIEVPFCPKCSKYGYGH